MGHNGKNGYFLKGLLIGGFGGALAALLLAPKSGDELREDIREKGSEVLEETKDLCWDARKATMDAFEDSMDQLSDAYKKARKILHQA